MLNYWWVTRPKRKLNAVPEVLSTFAEISLDQEWQGQRASHLSLEDALEQAGLKRKGERRDQRGGGARTYRAWLASLGLIFTQESTGNIKLTLAGEAIMNGDSPVPILTNQILKYQFPSPFSMSRGVHVHPRFKIRPFRFLLRLLTDARIAYLTEEEIAKIIAVEGENESEKCYEFVVARILEFRDRKDACLDQDFLEKYQSSRQSGNPDHPFSHLMDLANTLVNWLDYTQLIEREPGRLRILEDRKEDVLAILAQAAPLIDRPHEQEFFQRKYGLDPKHRKDTRNLIKTKTITEKIIAEQKIKQQFIRAALKQPITKITPDLVTQIAEQTGFDPRLAEDTLLHLYPHGAVGAFMTEYFEMAFKGREEAVPFEKATVELFRDVFGFASRHVGPAGLTPDVLILSDSAGYQAILDNKAYSSYTISNDHHNRMVHNYIKNLPLYSDSPLPLAFFSYIAGGFGTNIDAQLKRIASETGVPGSAVSVSHIIKMVEQSQRTPYTHTQLREIFSVNRRVQIADL